MAQRFMFTSISKQPIDLGDISAQTQATCEIWEMEPNFKYLLWEGMKTYVRSTFGTTNFHFPLPLTPSLHTVHTHTHTLQGVRIRSEACKLHQTAFVIRAPKPASVRWDSWKSLSGAIRSDYGEMSHYLKPGRRPRGTVCSCRVTLEVRRSPAVLSRYQSRGVGLRLQPQIRLWSWG